jgi:hypothetical protein
MHNREKELLFVTEEFDKRIQALFSKLARNFPRVLNRSAIAILFERSLHTFFAESMYNDRRRERADEGANRSRDSHPSRIEWNDDRECSSVTDRLLYE